MPLFNPNEPTNYQDIFRAVGRLMDAEGYHHFRLIEQEDGLILQVRHGSRIRNFETYLLTREDVQALLNDLYRLRSQASDPQPQ